MRLSELEAWFHQTDHSPVGATASQAKVAADQLCVAAVSHPPAAAVSGQLGDGSKEA